MTVSNGKMYHKFLKMILLKNGNYSGAGNKPFKPSECNCSATPYMQDDQLEGQIAPQEYYRWAWTGRLLLEGHVTVNYYEEKKMKKKVFLKGSKLFSIARKKALRLDMQSKGLKLEELICRIQEKEGNAACFRKRDGCSEILCCWQASCGAEMQKD